MKQNKGKFFKGTCNKYDKYSHRALDLWGNGNNGNEKNNNRKPHFKGECNSYGGKGRRGVDFWLNNKEKEDEVNNLFVRDKFCGEVLESDNGEDLK